MDVKRFVAAAEIAIYFFIIALFALSYDSPHDFAGSGNGVLNDLSGVLPNWYLPFPSYDFVALTLGLASFYH